MNQGDLDRFEAELRRVEPARLPADFRRRLVAAKPARGCLRTPAKRPDASLGLWIWALRGVPGVAAIALIAIVGWKASLQPSPHPREHPALAETTGLKADDVQIRRDLVSDFDAIARLPGGEPVRFRCQKWMDQVTLRDKYRGLVVEQRTPRVEIVPVGLETY